jgi:hypothetical protein
MTKKVEASIQRALVEWISRNYPHVMVQATLNENSRHAIDMGCCVGIPDLLLFWRKNDIMHVIFLELKTKQKNSKMRDTQVEWYRNEYKKLEGANTHYAVARGFSEAKKEVTVQLAAV